MDLVLESLTKYQSVASAVFAFLLLISLVFTGSMYLRLRKFEKRWKLLWMGSQGNSIEELLHTHLEERILIRSTLNSVEDRLSDIETLQRSSKRFLGLVRYDAFPDVAGSQSFALAVFDDEGDGAILSSIVGRNSCRVYCKPIVGLRSERDLSQEEQRALKSAREGGVRTILSP